MFLLLSLQPDIPVNAWLLRPATVTVPEGSVLHCSFPAAVGLRTTTGVRVQDAIFGALAQAQPDVVPACGAGTITPIVFAEREAKGRLRVNVLEPMSGGTGGHSCGDGLHARDVVDIANLRNSPVETVERKASVRILGYGLRPDSAGAGKHRGGCGAYLEFEVLTADCTVTARGMERHRFRPWGLAGGQCGGVGRTTVRRNGAPVAQDIGKIDVLRLNRGDVVRVEIAGGAGHGDPFERDARKVQDDVADGFVTPEAALASYGVVLRDGVLQEDETLKVRRSRSRTGHDSLFTFGPERDAYEAGWTIEVWDRYIGHLYGMAAPARAEARTRLWTSLESLRQEQGTLTVSDVAAAWAAVEGQLGQAGAPA